MSDTTEPQGSPTQPGSPGADAPRAPSLRPRGPGRASAPPTSAIDLSALWAQAAPVMNSVGEPGEPHEPHESHESHESREPEIETASQGDVVDGAPANDAPVNVAPSDEPPADDASADEAPADDVSADDAPADEASADEAPADEASADDVSAGDAPADEAPATARDPSLELVLPTTPPPLVEPPAPQRQPFTSDLATQAMSVEEIAAARSGPRTAVPWTRSVPAAPASASGDAAEISTQAMSVEEVAEANAVVGKSAAADKAPDIKEPASALDSLFQPRTSARSLPELPAAPATSGAGIQRSAIHPPMPRGQKILLGIVGGLILVLVLVAVFLLAARLGEQAATADVTAEETAAPEETSVPELTVGPVAPGEYAWSDLLGGECLQPFDSAWAEQFTVVGCDTDHVAQVLIRGELPEADSSAYPGEEALAAEVAELCSAPTVLNYAAAGVMSDIQISSSYPANSADWDEGNRAYFCFVDRTSGETIPGDLRVPPAE